MSTRPTPKRSAPAQSTTSNPSGSAADLRSSTRPDVLSVSDTPEGLILAVLARPGASSDGLVGVSEGALVVRVSAPPVEGAANERLVRFMAKEVLGLPKSKVRLDAGERSRHKRLVIVGLSEAELREKVEAAIGKKD